MEVDFFGVGKKDAMILVPLYSHGGSSHRETHGIPSDCRIQGGTCGRGAPQKGDGGGALGPMDFMVNAMGARLWLEKTARLDLSSCGIFSEASIFF